MHCIHVEGSGCYGHNGADDVAADAALLAERCRDDRCRDDRCGCSGCAREIASLDWGGYPILRFTQVPERIDVHVTDRPGKPFLGIGEVSQGATAATIANAVADATGVRLRDLPLDRERVRAMTALS